MIYKLGFIAALSTLLVRFIISANSGVQFFDFTSFTLLESIFYLLSFVWVLLSIWDKYFRTRCPNCNSAPVSLIDKEELKRWEEIKQERQQRGPPDTPEFYNVDVIVTMVTMKFLFKCENCKHTWDKDNDIPLDIQEA